MQNVDKAYKKQTKYPHPLKPFPFLMITFTMNAFNPHVKNRRRNHKSLFLSQYVEAAFPCRQSKNGSVYPNPLDCHQIRNSLKLFINKSKYSNG